MRLVVISDTHTHHDAIEIPAGDVLVHAGDFTRRGSFDDLVTFDAFLERLPHVHKIVIAGNHDFCFEEHPERSRSLLTNAIYLQDEAVEIDGVKFYGSPWQPRFCDWAFNLDRGAQLREKWDRIPQETDVLITHGPPLGHGDRVAHGGQHVGCEDLLDAIRRVQPRLHLFGHIHEDAGITREGTTTCVNASICDIKYRPTQLPHVLEVELSP